MGGVAGAKSLGKIFRGILGHPSECQQMRTELIQGLFGALKSECKPELNWPVFYLHSETDDSLTPAPRKAYYVGPAD